MKTMDKIQRLSITLMMMLMATATWAYTVTFNNTSGITITAKVDGSAITHETNVMAGKTVILTVAENDTKYLTMLNIQSDVPAGGASAPRRSPSITIQGDVEVRQTDDFTYEFTMPIGNVTITPTFADRMDISSGTYVATITLAESSHVFDWLAHTPVISSVVANSTTLTEGTDYTVSGISAYTNAGTYTITVTGKGKYNGEKTADYTISPRNLAGQTGEGAYPAAMIQLSGTSFVYNNAIQKPTISGVYMNGQTLILDTDYQNVTYSNESSKDKGNYTVTITGKGNFTGNASATYTITQAPISEATFAGTTNFVYSGTVQSPTSFTLTYCGESLTATHYDLSYASGNSTDFSSTCNSTNIGTYKMKITAKDGTNYTGSKEIIYTISSAGPTIFSVGGTEYTGTNIYSTIYTGAEIEPAVVVKDGSGESATTLEEETHYKVIYSDNKNVGTAKISVVGIGVYNFVVETTFKITPKSVSGLTIELSQNSYTYNASTQKPTVTVKDGETTLTENKDYTLVNAGGVNVGTYHATITGVGNYTDSKTSGDYSITALSFSNSNTTITLSNTSYVYNGDEKRPEVVRVIIDGNVIPSSDYQSVYSDNTNAGTATVRITKSTTSNNLAVSTTTTNFATQSFTIEKKSIANVEITLDPSSFTFKNGVTQKPTTVTVVDKERGTSGVTLTSGTDYTLTNDGGIAAGVYDVTVTGEGNYIGTAKKSYVINETAGSTAITIADIADQTYTGAAITPTPTITYSYDATNTVTLNKDEHYTLSYINNTNVGEATVIVTLKGGYSGSATKTFNIVAKSLAGATVTPNTSFTYNGNVQKPSFEVVVDSRTLDAGVDYNVTYSGDAISAGTQNVTINGIGNYTGTQAGSYTIDKLSLSTATIKLPSEMFVYNRSDQKPTPVVSVGSLVISANDYDVSWDDDNDPATTTPNFENVGTKYITVTGKNNCQDSKGTTYVITAKQIDANMVTLAQTEMTYTGSALDPGVTVKDGETPLVQGTDADPKEYKLEITNNVNVGTATVKVTGQGNYTGVVQKTFNIQTQSQQDFTISDIAAVTYNGSEHKPTPTIQYGTVNLVNEKDYTLSYRNNVNAGTATVVVTGKGGYEGSSGTKNFTINPKQLVPANVSLSYSSVNYTGVEIKPAVTVLDGDNPLLENRDYTIVYSNNINAGTATVTVTGYGNYSTSDQTAGTIEKQFTISPLSIATGEVNLSYISTVFNGSVQKPSVQTVYANGHQLTATTDYTISWPETDYTNQGVKTVTVTGTGNYKDSKNATYTIEKKEVNSNMITLSGDGFNTVFNSFTYDGASHSPTVTVANGTLAMTLTTDYTLTNPAHTEVGNYVVQIDGTGNYKGTATKQYSIVTAGATAFTVEAIPAQTYTGLALMPEPVVKATVNNVLTTLTKGTHYTVAWANNVNVGTNTASVIVTGLDNYAGTQTVYFTINPKDLIANETTLSATAFSYNGTEQKPTVTVTDGGTMLVKDKDYTLAFPDDMINQGTKTITIKGTGNYAGQFTKTYNINQLSLSTATITLATLTSYVYDGTAKTPAVQLVKVGELVVPTTAYDVVYTSNTNVGTATVTITAKMGTNFKDGNSTTFNIEQKTVTSDMIYLSSENLEYTGNVQAPTVTVKDGTKVLALTTDYTLSNPGGTAVGTYEATITGQGNYKGSAKKQYSIIAEGATGFTVDEITGTFIYSGSPLTPAVTVKKAGTADVLTLNTDYTVAYTDNTNVGTATVTVTGKGNYSGTRTKNFTITAKTLADGMVALSSTSFTYTGSEQKPVVTVTDMDTNTPLTLNTDYQVIYPTDPISQGTKTITVKGIGNYTGEVAKTYSIGVLSLNDASVTLNELSSYVYDGMEKKPTVKEVLVGTLVVPVTGYTVTYPDDLINIGTKTMTITGKGNYTGSTTKSYVVTPKTVTKEMISLSSENLIYTGSTLKPTVTVKDGAKTLTEGTDYTLSNDGGIEVGTYSLTITGMGNYTGTASRTYNIITKGASVFSVSDIASVTYNGSEQEPEITVVDNSTTPATTLTKGTHYTVAYSNNRNVGLASVTVTGIGSYAGTVSKTFTITPKTLTGAMVTLSATSFVFNSIAQKPEVTIDDKNAANVSIITDNDYTILNNGGINVGDGHEVKVTGKGNYTGTVTKTYAITPLSIATADVTLYQLQSYVYDATAKKPGVREVMVGHVTVPTTGYDVSYGENTNVGTAKVTVTGKGNFKDKQTVEFTITGKPITSDMMVLSSENFVYNGGVQKPTVTVKDGSKTLTIGSDYTLTNEGGTSVGNYSVTVAGKGNYTSEASRTYSIVEKDGPTNFTISLSNTSVQYDGSEQKPSVTVTDGTKTLTIDTDYEVSYTNHVNVGTATVTVTGKGNYAGTKTATFTITAKPLTETMVTLSATTFVYNTYLQKPEVTVSDGSLMTGTDYVITNNGGTNQGTYHVIVNGQGNYSGQIDKTFSITPLSIADASVTLYQLQSYVYEGVQKKPGVREVAVGSIIVPTQGFTTTYGDNINAGTATVTVTGQGNYQDTKTVTFDIEQKAVENSMIALSNYEYTYNGEIQKPEVTVRDGETTLLLDTDYTLLNNGGKTVGAYDVTITGKGNYKGTASKTYIINAKEVGSFEVTLSTESVTYNGSEQQPEVTVKDGETVLTKGTHYTVSYTDNVNVGMATITVRGQGEYEGSRNKTFLILPKSLSDAMVSLNTTTFTYNGLLQMPAVTVSDGTALTSNDYYITNEGGLDKGTYNVMVTGRNNYTGTVVRQYAINPMSINDGQIILYQLQSYVYDGTAKNPGVREVAVGSHIIPSTSYTTAISSNINVGTVTVTVTGEKNYTGSTSTTFQILPKPVSSGMITLTPDYFYYNGSVQKPGVTVKDGQKNMVENTDYTVTNNGGTEAGEYEVKVKGIGNYTDEATQSFTILSSGVNTFVVTLEANEYTYDGTAHKPGATVMMNDRTLTEGTDYTLTYSNNTNAGTATVTVKGVGDYTGEQVKTFLIQPKTLTDAMVTLDRTSFIYNEKVQKPEVTVADGTIMTADDYEVTNDGGTTEGTYQVVVTGQNNYKGVVIKSFTITREDIHGDDDPQHPDEKPITYTPTEEGSDEVKVSGIEGTEEELSQVTNVTIPTTFTADGKTYKVVGIAANAFANTPNLTDIYMPDTEEPLVVAEGAIPASVTVHTTLALLDDYALMPSLSESFKAGKIKTTITAKNRYWTFSSGVDVYVPDGVSVYIARERNNATVTIVELSDNDLTVGGQRIIKHNNGVLISCDGNDTPYDLVACGRRMSSGATISTDDFKDYGSQNCLVPVILPTHFGAGYYFLKNNEFYSIQEESEDIKVPAGKAVLYLRQAASSPSYSSIIQLVNTGEVTNINGIEKDAGESDWYDMSGRKLDGRPTKKGVYIKNNKKIVIR